MYFYFFINILEKRINKIMILNNIDENSSVIDGMFELMHEVKNSIAVCRGYLDIISCDNNKDIKKYLSIISSEINRSTDIISDFMIYRKSNIIKEIMDIGDLLNNLCYDMDDFVKIHKIKFDYNIMNDDVYIMGDYDKLKQVFINLIKNSIESINSENGKIFINSYLDDKKYNIIIQDNGCGMSDDVLKKVKSSGFTTKVTGSGIGVNFSTYIIEEHSGCIYYYSKVNVGTKVVVQLPIVVL